MYFYKLACFARVLFKLGFGGGDVVPGVLLITFDFFAREWADDFGRIAKSKASGRNICILGYESPGADDTVLPNAGSV